jgi:hypothetical protein
LERGAPALWFQRQKRISSARKWGKGIADQGNSICRGLEVTAEQLGPGVTQRKCKWLWYLLCNVYVYLCRWNSESPTICPVRDI